MKRISSVLFSILLLVSCTSTDRDEIGKPYRGWKPGEFDIHHIHTGMGEANFFIMPDGTSLLIDSGDLGPNDPSWEMPRVFPPIPECEFHPGKYVARYILRVNPNAERVDYFLSSHFHDDHLTNSRAGAQMTRGRNPDYVLSGIAETGEWIRFGKFFDRGYPDYDYPVAVTDPDVMNFRNFVKNHAAEHGSVQEKFEVGAKNQIAMTNKLDKYAKLFSIKNIAANGEVWTGSEAVRWYDQNPANTGSRQNENTKSIALRFDYGPFSYYTGGDVAGSLLDAEGNSVNIEVKVGEACGQVDVCKTNHHAYKDAMKEGFITALNPKHYVSCAWDIWHTQPVLMERMLKRPDAMIFHQFVWPDQVKDYLEADWYDRLYTKGGHIVVKAFDKGRQYKIYILEDSNEDMIIKDIFGPFNAE